MSSSTVDSYFDAISSADTDKVRAILSADRTVTKEKRKGEYKFEAGVELDAYKFLGAYIGALTGLQFAILIGAESVARDIVDYTFEEDLDIQFGKANTALHLAVFLGSKDVVKLLLDRGADKTVKNGKGFTPVDVSDDPEVLQILTESASTRSMRSSTSIGAIEEIKSADPSMDMEATHRAAVS